VILLGYIVVAVAFLIATLCAAVAFAQWTGERRERREYEARWRRRDDRAMYRWEREGEGRG